LIEIEWYLLKWLTRVLLGYLTNLSATVISWWKRIWFWGDIW